jgi:hypothetical protein
MNNSSVVESKGFIDIKIEDKNGLVNEYTVKNTVLRTGRYALAKTITNNLDDNINLYVIRMIFGSSGTSGGQPKIVNTNRTSLFGPVVSEKPVLASIDSNNPTQAIFTSVLGYNDANGYALSEMALVLNDNTLYSMATFGDLNKTNQIQITFNWRINYI